MLRALLAAGIILLGLGALGLELGFVLGVVNDGNGATTAGTIAVIGAVLAVDGFIIAAIADHLAEDND